MIQWGSFLGTLISDLHQAPANETTALRDLVGNVTGRLSIDEKLRMDVDEFVNIDNETETFANISDEQILESVKQIHDETTDDQEEEEVSVHDTRHTGHRRGNVGYHPQPGASIADWCSCNNCREMPTPAERLCCRKNPQNCLTLLPDFIVLILDEAVLSLARLYRQDKFALQFILWQHGRLGVGDRRVIPSCSVWKIRDKFPDPFGQYTGFKPSILT
ncbi:uncharacterized protein LOC121389058 [Gigantopelta aegis]|uniref:uncharacterized protein LOC121389058 n=1 Tax=Gigantopelta aegis TaxID=1735272 RepID=UPI001B88D1F2|nr:uncharacterized protein LOC121389058 [Gigantopelta aegis]